MDILYSGGKTKQTNIKSEIQINVYIDLDWLCVINDKDIYVVKEILQKYL